MSFLGDQGRSTEPAVQVQIGENEPHSFYLHGQNKSGTNPSRASSALPTSDRLAHIFDVGIFRDTLAPSLALHGSLAVAAWGVGRYTDRVETKDWLWPAGFAANIWWTAVGRRVLLDGRSITQTFSAISWPERLLLTGVTAWSARTFYRIATRSVRRGKDDPRYETSDRKEPDFWSKQLLTKFLPEAVFQSIIALPFTAPFRHQGAVMTGYHPLGQMAGVGVFSAGMALETLADYQLDKHQKEEQSGMCRDGVWSIVRHPNYLGDALIHAAFPILLYSSDMLAPVELLGPIANYVFLRYFGGDKENEASQEERYKKEDPTKMAQLNDYREAKNSFWPGVEELKNQWTWIVVGASAVGVALEQGLRSLH